MYACALNVRSAPLKCYEHNVRSVMNIISTLQEKAVNSLVQMSVRSYFATYTA